MNTHLKLFALVILFGFCELSACTGIRLTAEDRSSVTGRTVEFGTMIEMSTAVVPRKYTFTGQTPAGNGLVYTAKYAAVGIYCFTDRVLMDGMNEKGLVAAAFYFPGYAQYATITKDNQSKALSPMEFPNWILTQFATLEEVKKALPSVVIAPTVGEGWGSTPPPFHYVVYDQEGRSLVIEPLNGKLVVYDNKIGTITNSPTFDWQMTNLRNYINLSPFSAEPIDMRGVNLAPFGQGSGMVGLPGDFTPPSRFVRAAIFSSVATPAQDAKGAVEQAFHILNQFDIPMGVAKSAEGMSSSIDYTLLTSVKDPQSKQYYFRTYGDQTVRYIGLMEFDLDAKEIVSGPTTGRPAPVDVSSSLKNKKQPPARP